MKAVKILVSINALVSCVCLACVAFLVFANAPGESSQGAQLDGKGAPADSSYLFQDTTKADTILNALDSLMSKSLDDPTRKRLEDTTLCYTYHRNGMCAMFDYYSKIRTITAMRFYNDTKGNIKAFRRKDKGAFWRCANDVRINDIVSNSNTWANLQRIAKTPFACE